LEFVSPLFVLTVAALFTGCKSSKEKSETVVSSSEAVTMASSVEKKLNGLAGEKSQSMIQNKATAYVCVKQSCSFPTTDINTTYSTIRERLGRGRIERVKHYEKETGKTKAGVRIHSKGQHETGST
jgi:uncharacterized protein YyaL (SSP411 family)